MRFVCPDLLRRTPDALAEISVDVADQRSSPIFLMSAGWRSGSTFLQRLICSDPNVLIWGEPLEDRLILPRMHAMVADYSRNDGHIKYAIDSLQGELTDEWIANLNPGYQQLLRAQRCFFESFFDTSNYEQKRPRWGVKSVRWSAHHAKYLKLLYPNAKLVFLVRNPLDAWRSYRGRTWYAAYPDYKVDNVFKFCAHWKYMADSFLEYVNELGGLLVRYEDIRAQDKSLSELETYLDVNIDRSVIKKQIGSSFGKQAKSLGFIENRIARFMTSPVARRAGYEL